MTSSVVRRSTVCCLFSIPPLLFLGGCESGTGTGALIGTLVGAGAGAAIGSHSGARAGEGAAIGAGVGLLSGALIGAAADSADDERRRRQNYDRIYADTSTPSAPPTIHQTPNYQTPSYQVDARPPGSYGYPLSDKDIIRWTSQGVREDIIIDRIQRSGTTFKLTAADENRLRDEGVSENVLAAMRPRAATPSKK